MQDKKSKEVAVVGAGLVGALEACYLAKRGYNVHLYEHRDDIRTMEYVPGRSINLAISLRGRSALKIIGVEDDIIKRHGIPMKARMIHNQDGSIKEIPYNKDGKCIYSVGRRFVNEVLLTKAESFRNIKIYFTHKLVGVDFQKGQMTFEVAGSKSEVKRSADVIIGCDGAYSVVRRQMLKLPHFNYNQQYILHGYMELCIPPTPDGEFAMPVNYLHIWPRGHYMMIALPNQDKSWTVTLFMPFDIFKSLSSPEKLMQFFEGMEDCIVLDNFLEEFDDDLTKAFPAYSSYRNPDAEAIIDLALYNYTEVVRRLLKGALGLAVITVYVLSKTAKAQEMTSDILKFVSSKLSGLEIL